jgi:hypothetical protein
MEIRLIENTTFPNIEPIRENMDIFIPDINVEGLPNRNGSIWLLCGSGGSGKSSLMINCMINDLLYKAKFDNIFYICPEASFSSVKDNPFKDHDKVYHELTAEFLEMLFNTLERNKLATLENRKKKKEKRGKKNIKVFVDDDENKNADGDEVSEDDCKIKYNCVIIDDFADQLKNYDISKAMDKLLIKARHLNTIFIILAQSFYYIPKIIRKQLTNLTLFEPKNVDEWYSVSRELFNLKPDDALDLYNFVFDKKYNHIDLDKNTNTYYKNFNQLELKKSKGKPLHKTTPLEVKGHMGQGPFSKKKIE